MQKQIERLIDRVAFPYHTYNGRIAAGYQRACPTVHGLEYYAATYAPYHDHIAVAGGVRQIDDILASIEGTIEACDCGDITRELAVAEVRGLAEQLSD